MKTIRNIYAATAAAVCAALLSAACTDPINIVQDGYQPHLTIVAMLNNQPAQQTVTLSLAAPYFDNSATTTAVTDAQVFIAEKGMPEEQLQHSPTKDGVYVTRPDFAIKSGVEYTLRVEHNGKTYTAADIAPDSIAVVSTMIMSMNTNINTGVDTAVMRPTYMISGGVWRANLRNIHVRLTHLHNGKQLRERLANYSVGEVPDGAGYGVNPVFAPMLSSVGSGWFMTQDGGDTLYYAPRDTVGVQMHTLSYALFRYISSAQHESYGGSNPMFGGVPSDAEGNISGGAMGVFGLYCTGGVSNVVLPVNYRSFDHDVGYVHYAGGDSTMIKISHGRATYTYPPHKKEKSYFEEQLYFDTLRVSPDSPHFTAERAGIGERTFLIKNYWEFWEIAGSDTIKWRRWHRKTQEERRTSVLLILS